MFRRELWPLVRVWRWGRARVCTWPGWWVGSVWGWGRISGFSCGLSGCGRSRLSSGGWFRCGCGSGSGYRLALGGMSLCALVVVVVVVVFAMLAVFAVPMRQIGEFLGCVHLVDVMLRVLAILKAQMVWVDHHLVLP